MLKNSRLGFWKILFYLVVIVVALFDYMNDKCFGWGGAHICGDQALIPAGGMILSFLFLIIYELRNNAKS